MVRQGEAHNQPTVLRHCHLREFTEHIEVCRYTKYNMVLELAVSGGARHIVTGDADLLGLNPFRGIVIASPDAFVASIRPVL